MANPRPQAQGKLLQENERVITTEWRLQPGAETGWHRHAHDYVVTELAFGQTYARPEGVEHNIVNPNRGEFVFIEIELK